MLDRIPVFIFLIRIFKIPQYWCHLNNVRNATEGSLFTIDKKHVAHCCCSAGTPKIIPASAAVSHWWHSNDRIIHSRVLSREHRAELEFLRGIAAINHYYIQAGYDRMYHTCTCFWVLRTHSRALNFCGPQIAIRRVTAFNNYKGSLQMWYIDLIQQINKQVLHDFALYHQRK